MKTGSRLKRKGGFTLIELMMAMVIVSLGLFAVAQMGVVTVRGNAYAREWMEAYDVAQAAMEELKARATQWVKFSGQEGLAGTLISGTVVENMVPEASLVPYPGAGSDLDWGAAFRSALLLHGKTIAGTYDVNASQAVNIHGDDVGPRTIFRVHYVAHWMPINACPSIDPAIPCDQGNADSNFLRLTVFVSWDNKDHGDQTAPWDDIGQDAYWKRHMVSVTSYIYPNYSWSMGL